MDIAGLSLMTNREVVVQYERSLLDLGWLEQMAYSCDSGSAAKKHYMRELEKEQKRVEALRTILKKRRLMQ